MRTADTVDRLRSYFETDHHGALAVYLFGSIVEDIVENRLVDLEQFAKLIRERRP